ncbi:MAG: division/cell wall cluster transcriptional repressor MraZ [Chitinophagia bacterium]|nr:division/cell wall cluster transcriptional repressor MraZ [Chitinophagia bacterium]
MANIVGEYEVTVDGKGRFLLPAAFRRDLPPGCGEKFMINRGQEKCLTLYITEEWEKLINERINTLDDVKNKDDRDFKRRFYSGLATLVPDSADRVLIPKPLLEYAGIVKDAVFQCQGNKVEIWDKVTLEQYLNNLDN